MIYSLDAVTWLFKWVPFDGSRVSWTLLVPSSSTFRQLSLTVCQLSGPADLALPSQKIA